MKAKPVLIVDDEKNIRLTLSQSLEALDLEMETAVNGEEALTKLKEKDFGLILLDLNMPGVGGMEVLRQISEIRPDIRVIIITAHGTIDSAVEAMKKGAVDFIQKPFSPREIRDLVSEVIARETGGKQKADDYILHLDKAKKCIEERHLGAAEEHARQAIAIDSSHPEAFNVIGAIYEIRGDRLEAQKNYRAALSIDGSYTPAEQNLLRTTNVKPGTEIMFDAPGSAPASDETKA